MSAYREYFSINSVDPIGMCQRDGGCCCCAENVAFSGQAQGINANPFTGHAGGGIIMRIDFETNWEFKKTDPKGSTDCRMQWIERSERGNPWPQQTIDQMERDIEEQFDVEHKIKQQDPKKWYD